MIKKSKKLNDLVNKIVEFCPDNFIDDINADCFALADESTQYGIISEFLNSHIMGGINLIKKSIKTKHPIYCAYSKKVYGYFYFVGDLKKIINKLQNIYDEMVNDQETFDERFFKSRNRMKRIFKAEAFPEAAWETKSASDGYQNSAVAEALEIAQTTEKKISRS